MDTELRKIDHIMDEKIALFRELLSLLEEERTSITERDVSGIWQSTEQKNRIVEDIRQHRREIFRIATGQDSPADSGAFDVNTFLKAFNPSEALDAVRGKSRTIKALKKDIHERSRENSRFVREYLSVYENLLETMLGASSGQPQVYNSRSVPRKSSGAVYFREA